MVSRVLLRSTLLTLLCLLLCGVHPCLADSSHARIIRLSLIQGDVRFARDVHGDPLASQTATWEAAELNLPIRQGYVLATDNGRAEVEFENGAMAFLDQNTVLEFYDLSLVDGAKTTRLVLRQGTASFYVNPSNGDYFSVTGGDFTVEAVDRGGFRVNNFDDGSTVNVVKGHVSILRKDKTTALAKGQSLTMRAGDENSLSIARLPDSDDFDRWVSGREDTVATATAAAQQYVNSPYYTSGLADLYTYGSWCPITGYGYGWRPYGVGYGWSPFASGGWFMDPIYGMSFIGNAPWGWLPYHYGGWVFDPILGWVWAPSGFLGGGYIPWSPVTGVFVRSKPGLIGIVPVHPLDAHGKTPINLARGVFPVSGGGIAALTAVNSGEYWKTLKSVPRGTLTTTIAASTTPTRVSRTVLTGSSGARLVTLDRVSSIVYDPREHRFVNTNAASTSTAKTTEAGVAATQTGRAARFVAGSGSEHGSSPAPVRTSTAYMPRSIAPPPVPRAEGSRAGGAWYGGGAGSRGEASSRVSAPSAAASSSHTSARSTASSGGGRAH
jgi:Family of unknown function (DUF6600)/FecR protein